MEKQGCDHCDRQFQPAKSWQRFCTPKCRDAWHYEQWKFAAEEDKRSPSAAEITEVNGLREQVDGNAIVSAIKYGRPVAPAPAIVAENGMKRRSL
jgi:hypothetical protein